jgi:penicillin-binding protein 1A
MSSAAQLLLRKRLLKWALGLFALGILLLGLFAGYVYLFVIPNLPTLEAVTDYRPKIPLRVYTADNALIGEFGEEHRNFVPIKEMPDVMKKALLAAEDSQFYEHGAIDSKGMARAIAADIGSLSFKEGAGTITMQVAREFFLTRKKFLFRKLTEILLSYRIESALTKDQILELYMNQMYLGEHTFGFGSASQVYFGKSISDISLAEAAVLAGLPKGPTTNNPIVNPKRAKARQQYILGRMHTLGWITDAQFNQASSEVLHVKPGGQSYTTHAEYAAELVRQQLYKMFKDETYTRGYVVYTTLTKAAQDAAYEAVRRNVIDYDHRHGYRGPEGFVELPAGDQDRDDAIDEALAEHPASDNLLAAVAVEAGPKLVKAELPSGEVVDITGEGLHFAAPGLAANASNQKKIRVGSILRISQNDKGKWEISELPEVAAAFVAIDASDGAYKALVGGFDFNLNKFDHVSQAWRQPGSSFKPFVYSAALEKGFSPATLINDVPLVVTSAENGGGPEWEPQNDDGFDGKPITMRYALAKSKNVPSVRILKAITPEYAHDYVTRFGFDPAKQPVSLTMTLGTGAVTPLQLAGAYAVFANGGYQIPPYMVQKIVDIHGAVISEAKPAHAGEETERAIDPRNAFIMHSMLQQVVRSGTGAMATQKLGRPDLAGKTGTTSDALDGWFAGYSGNLVAVSWMGYDEPKSLGSREFGATLALPAWIEYMRVALKNVPVTQREAPSGVEQVDGDWMYTEFEQEGAVKTLGMDDAATENQPTVPTSPTAPNQPAAPQAPAAPNQPVTPTAPQPPAKPTNDQERQKAIDLFK